MTSKGFLTVSLLIWSFFAYADLGNTNKDFVDHLQYYYQVTHHEDLNLKILPQRADTETVYKELRVLESVLFDTASAPPQSLIHLACSVPACGGCGHAVCAPI